MLRRKASKIEVKTANPPLLQPPPPLPPLSSNSSPIKTLPPKPNASASPPSPPNLMEVEVKLRLKDSTAHRQLISLLSPFHVETLDQHNLFFDTPTSSFSSQRTVLRLRFFGKDSHCVVCLKSKSTLVNGVSRVEEDEEEIDPVIGIDCVENPSKLFDIESRVVRRVREEFGLASDEVGLVCLGGFENVREVYEWKGLKLEVDETKYCFGTSYEVECESGDPEGVKKLLEEFLNENGIEYKYSEMIKFAVFRAGKLP